MKSTELRIGNLFIDKESGTVISVIELTKEIITFTGDFEGDWQAEPIEITLDWLIFYGFILKGGYYYLGKLNDYPFKIEYCEGLVFFVCQNIEYHYKYVHELQNLYFAMTKTELSYD